MCHSDNWLISVLVKIEGERKDSLRSNSLKSADGIFKGRASILNVFT